MTPLAALVLLLAQPAIDAKSPDPSVKFFDPKMPLPTIRIEVDKENLKQLKQNQPAMSGIPRKTVHATFKLDDEVFPEMGLHLKGAAGSFRGWDDKPALTLNSNKFRKHQLMHGLDKFHLNNSVQDDLYLNEIVTCEIFRRAGVPAARGTHAFVELNGRKVGLYLLKEGFDKTFLHRYFTNVNGELYDGGFLKDIDESPKPDAHLKALAAAARIENHKDRFEAMEKKLDMDKFFALWAVEVMCCDWDGYCRNKNNYRIYHDPAMDKIVLFAHGKDQMFQNVQEPLVHGWGGLLARRLWETEEGRRRYIAKVREVLDKQFKLDEIFQQIDAYAKRLQEYLNEMQDGAGDQYLQNVKQYKNRIKARYEFMMKEAPKLKP
jgi:spore coat protein H